MSTFDATVLANFYIGDAFVAPFRLMSGILQTIKDMHHSFLADDYNFGLALTHHLAMGPLTADSDECLDVRAIPAEAHLLLQISMGFWPRSTSFRMRDLRPDAWNAVVLRDDVSVKDHGAATETKGRRTSRFRVVMLRPKRLMCKYAHRRISANDFEVMALPAFSCLPYSHKAEDLPAKMMEDGGPNRTVIQLKVGSVDVSDAVVSMQELLDESVAWG